MNKLDYYAVILACISLGCVFLYFWEKELANRFLDIVLVFFWMLLWVKAKDQVISEPEINIKKESLKMSEKDKKQALDLLNEL